MSSSSRVELGHSPGAEVLEAPGHVGFFGGFVDRPSGRRIRILGGNQSDRVSLECYDVGRVLGVRRLLMTPRDVRRAASGLA